MMRLKLLSSMFALALCATSVLAAPQVRYRLTQIIDPPGFVLTPTALNNRGEVVGAQGGADQRGFYWRDGTFIDIHDQVSPSSIFVEAAGINDRSEITGSYLDPDVGLFRGFLLDRDEVLIIEGPPGADNVFVGAINDREQILGTNFELGGDGVNFLWDRGTITIFDSFRPSDINDHGTVSGTQFFDGSARAAIWEDGEISPIGPPATFGRGINNRGQVIGSVSETTGDRAFVWERGRLTVLPALRADQASYFALDINNAGRIVGETQIIPPEANSFQIATVWDDGQVLDLNTLIHPDDPLRGFVTLGSALFINDRGEIVASGTDSRTQSLGTYFLEPVRR